MEFALLAPVFVLGLVAGFEGSRMFAMSRHLANFSNSVAYDFASLNDTVGGVITVQGVRLYEFATRIGLLTPELAGANLYNHVRYKIGFTMVQMTPTVAGCATGCTYTANVAWSWGDLTRACGTLASTANNSAYDATKLPAGAFQAGAVAVVDVQATYLPAINAPFFTQRTISVSQYYPVTSNNFTGNYLPWDGVNDWWNGTKCSGYP
ncbi:MAG: hypothetical protein KGM42_20460 [Hyphomicrobiales bacterium]|nr:hypothetical protein [Hyphomicrobiales bacterium]